jgi:hypothetical protein
MSKMKESEQIAISKSVIAYTQGDWQRGKTILM